MADWAGTINDKAKDIWTNVFWKSPNHLWALKVTASIVFLVIGAELLLDDSFVGTTMALGVVAMALGETDVHPRGRMKSAGIGLTLFFVVSALVGLLSPYLLQQKPFPIIPLYNVLTLWAALLRITVQLVFTSFNLLGQFDVFLGELIPDRHLRLRITGKKIGF